MKKRLLIVPSNDPLVRSYFEQTYQSESLRLSQGQELAFVPSPQGLENSMFCAPRSVFASASSFMRFLQEKVTAFSNPDEATLLCIVPYECSGTAQLAADSFRKPSFVPEFATFDPKLVTPVYDFDEHRPMAEANPAGYLLMFNPDNLARTNAIMLRSQAA